MPLFPDLVHRHRVDPGPLVHVGVADGEEIPAYYEAGFFDITVVDSSPDRIKALRTRFPGVDVKAMTEGEDPWLDAVVLAVNMPGQELAVLTSAPWDRLIMLIVETSADPLDHASPYDLVTEAATTRGFVEVDRWTRDTAPDGNSLSVAFMKIS